MPLHTEGGIDDAVEPEDQFPREDAQEIAGPERKRDQDEPRHLVPSHVKCDVVGGRVRDQHRRERNGEADQQRTPEHARILRLLHDRCVVLQREPGRRVVRHEAVASENRQRDDKRKQHQHQHRCEQHMAGADAPQHARLPIVSRQDCHTIILC